MTGFAKHPTLVHLLQSIRLNMVKGPAKWQANKHRNSRNLPVLPTCDGWWQPFLEKILQCGSPKL